MYTNERSHGRPGGSIATVYGNETLRTVTGIEELSRLGRDSGGAGNFYSRSEKRQKDDAFAGILENEQKKTEEPKDISLRSVTYTRTGMPSAIYVLMRDYTNQIRTPQGAH